MEIEVQQQTATLREDWKFRQIDNFISPHWQRDCLISESTSTHHHRALVQSWASLALAYRSQKSPAYAGGANLISHSMPSIGLWSWKEDFPLHHAKHRKCQQCAVDLCGLNEWNKLVVRRRPALLVVAATRNILRISAHIGCHGWKPAYTFSTGRRCSRCENWMCWTRAHENCLYAIWVRVPIALAWWHDVLPMTTH